jgi:hypothetical protein
MHKIDQIEKCLAKWYWVLLCRYVIDLTVKVKFGHMVKMNV